MDRPKDGGSYSRDPKTGQLTQLEPPTAPPPGKSARASRRTTYKPDQKAASTEKTES